MLRRAILIVALLVVAIVGPATAGGSSGLSFITTNIIVTVCPEHENQAFGQETAWLGDVNADGHDDFLVIDKNQVGPGYAGRAYVFFGGPEVDDQPDLVLQQDDTGSIQQALAGPFDFNGDGHGDVAISSPNYDVGGHENAGAVFVYHGGPNVDDVADLVIPGPWTRYYFGRGLARAGRFGGDDEYDDLAVTIDTSPGWGPMPTVYVYFGGPTPPADHGWARSWPEPYPVGFADHLEYAGDQNGDGAGDLVHGLPLKSGPYFDGEEFQVVEGVGGILTLHGGAYMPHIGTLYQPIDTGEAYLGYDVDGDVDINGDGLADVVATAPFIEHTRVVLGAEDVVHGGPVLDYVPGEDVGGLGDVNGDDYDDIAIADLSGAVWIFWGGAAPDAIPDQAIRADDGAPWDHVTVGRAGDIDHDGLDDIMVHFTRGTSPHRIDRVRVYKGSSVPTATPDSPAGDSPLIYEGGAPSPFNAQVTIAFRTFLATRIQMRVFDLQGRLVRSLFDGDVPAGKQATTWDGTDDAGRGLPSGPYMVQILGEGRAVGGRVMLVK